MNSIKTAYDNYCELRFPATTENAISELESRLEISFPPHYRDYLLEWNGGYFENTSIVPPCTDDEDEEAYFPSATVEGMFGIGASKAAEDTAYAELGRDHHIHLWDDNDPIVLLPIGDTSVGAFITLWLGEDGFGEVALKTFDEYFPIGETMEEFFSYFGPKQETLW